MRALLLLLAVVLAACPAPTETPDASTPFDAGVPCDSPEDCASIDAVCRQSICQREVPCSDDLECGLGERCVNRQCRFRGCVQNDDCSTGFCDVATFSCAECGQDRDCPVERPVCDTTLRQCRQCSTDDQCAVPGPAHCSPEGRCVGCLTDDHCPNGLTCSPGHTCVGVPSMAPCPMGTACGAGLVCVTLNSAPVCLPACTLYAPSCAAGQICYSLSYSSTTSLVFESDGPIGVCFAPQSGLRGLREPCSRTPAGSNCQPNLVCIPETASLSLCRSYCDPFASGTCPAGERCTSFVGDFNGREYGVCMADTGFGARCQADSTCRAGLSCQPYEDPSDFDEVGAVCQFNQGDAGALAPCRPVPLPDGGAIPASKACRSGACVNDPLVFSPVASPYFCFAACDTDRDCRDAGVCDADFTLTTVAGNVGEVRGCRPTCERESDCAGYGDGGIACRVRVVASASSPSFTTTCSPSAGALPPGSTCTSSSQCRSALCVLSDSRGVARAGVCAAPCRDGDVCASDAYPLACQPTTHLLSRGFDGVAGTLDDRFATRRLCSGAACTSDADCRTDGGVAVCAPQIDPASLTGGLVLRCSQPTAGAKAGGEACTSDLECASGLCGTLQSPSTGSGRACFEACTGATTCGAGLSCRTGGMAAPTASGATVSLSSCAP